MNAHGGAVLAGWPDPRFHLVASRDDTGARYEIYALEGERTVLARLRPNQGAITTSSMGEAFVEELERLRPASAGGFTLLFWPVVRLRPTPDVRRRWARFLKQGNVDRLCLLNYDALGTPYKVVAQLLISAAGMRNARFFSTIQEALEWAHGMAPGAGAPVYPYQEGEDEERGSGGLSA